MSPQRPPAFLCYDGSEDADHAIRAAAAVLAPRPAVVAHVWESLAALLLHTDVRSLAGPMKDAAQELDAGDEEDARRVVDRGVGVAREAGFDSRALVARGRPKAWPTLLEAADAEDAAVVVVGSRGLSGAMSALLGSVSAGVLHHSRRPALVVPPGRVGDGPLLLAYDGSDLAKDAMRRAADLLRPGPAVVVTAWTAYGAVASVDVLGGPGTIDPETQQQVDAEIVRGAEHVAGEGAELARALGFEAEPAAALSGGSVWRALVDYCGESMAAAIVIGSHGRGRLASTIMGSVSRALIHHAPAPVLVVPPDQ